jgi:myo-inositol-1(or 4)-monophosphatase
MLYSGEVIRIPDPAAWTQAGMQDRLAAIAVAAGRVALTWFRPGARSTATTAMKPGNSPVSEADHAVDAYLKRALSDLAEVPGSIGWFSEESAAGADHAATTPRMFWLVDPIDGTRAFLSGDPHWAISIALIDGNRPVLAALHGPALGLTLAAARGDGAYLGGMRLGKARRAHPDRLRVVAPKPLFDASASGIAGVERLPPVPSLALRLAQVATGQADLAMASRGAHGWDVAAVDLILNEAGAALCEFSRQPLSYLPRADRLDGLLAAPECDLAALHQSLALPSEPG